MRNSTPHPLTGLKTEKKKRKKRKKRKNINRPIIRKPFISHALTLLKCVAVCTFRTGIIRASLTMIPTSAPEYLKQEGFCMQKGLWAYFTFKNGLSSMTSTVDRFCREIDKGEPPMTTAVRYVQYCQDSLGSGKIRSCLAALKSIKHANLPLGLFCKGLKIGGF